MSEENKAIVRRGYEEIWNGENLAAVDEIYAPGFVLYDPVTPGVRGPEGFKQYVTMIRTAFPDLHFTVKDQIAEGDKVATRWTVTGTQQGQFMGIPPTGKHSTVTGITISRIADGKIVEERSNWDALGMLQQAGVVPPMGEGGK